MPAMGNDELMTVGDLAHRTGVSARLIRQLTDRGLIYSPGRSDANYRMYEESAVWCVETIAALRGLGLTIREIERLGDAYLGNSDLDPRELFEQVLMEANARLGSKIEKLEEARSRQQQVLAGEVRRLIDPDPTRA